jgi:hypothetical protein
MVCVVKYESILRTSCPIVLLDVRQESRSRRKTNSKGRTGIVGVTTRVKMDGEELKFPSGQQIFSLPNKSRPSLRSTQPVLPCEPGVFPGIKRSKLDVDLSPPSRSSVVNECRFTSKLPLCLDGMYGTSLSDLLHGTQSRLRSS